MGERGTGILCFDIFVFVFVFGFLFGFLFLLEQINLTRLTLKPWRPGDWLGCHCLVDLPFLLRKDFFLGAPLEAVSPPALVAVEE